MKSDFRKKLEKMFDKNVNENQTETTIDDAYSTQTTTRNICFIPKEGEIIFLNYAYLISGEYDGDSGIITLSFTTHTVTIKGYGLESTYYAFMEHIPRKLSLTNERYREILEEDNFMIQEINIEKTK